MKVRSSVKKICEHCKLVYEIRDDIPIMLIDEAKPLEDEPRKS